MPLPRAGRPTRDGSGLRSRESERSTSNGRAKDLVVVVVVVWQQLRITSGWLPRILGKYIYNLYPYTND